MPSTCLDEHFEMVVSNSLVHHLPEPLPFFLEVSRVLKTNGAILIRDLIRPPHRETMNRLVESMVPNTTPARNSYSATLSRRRLH